MSYRRTSGRRSRGVGGKFSSHIRFDVSNGFKIRFQHDLWCGDKALKIAFLDLFNLAHCKDAFMAYYFEFSSDSLVECLLY